MEAEAKAKQVLAGGDKKSEEAKSLNSALNEAINTTSSAESLKKIPQATQQASKIMGVGSTLISAAKAIAKVSPEMAEAIKNGDITVSTAEKKLKESGVLGNKKTTKPSISKTKERDKAIADVPYTTAIHALIM